MNPLFRQSGDPVLAEIAKKAKTLPPHSDPRDAYKEYFDESFKTSMPRNIKKCPDNSTWKLVLFIGGHRRTLAYMETKRVHELARLADFLVMRLWKFKSNRVGPPEQAQLNYPMDWAEEDAFGLVETWPEALAFAEEIENHLVTIGAVSTVGPAIRKPRTPRASLRKSLVNIFEEKQAAIIFKLDQLDRIENKLDTLLAKFP